MTIWEFSGKGGNTVHRYTQRGHPLTPGEPEEPDSKWVDAIKTVMLLGLLCLLGWGAFSCSSYFAEQEAKRRAAELAAWEKQCDAQPRACAEEIMRLQAALKKEKEGAGFGTGFVVGQLLR